VKIKNFEEVVSWQKSRELSKLVYKLFKESKDFSFRDQIQRASISIMNNIAEGFERESSKDLKRFLFVAKGSSAEVRSMLHIALDLNYISKDDFSEAYALSTDISRLLSGFIKKLY
jgi:four helix bundle protein